MEKWQERFYNSKKWRKLRQAVIARDNGVCRMCGNVIFDTPTVHHEVELTADNVHDKSISLNADLLVTVCRECHDRTHERFNGPLPVTDAGVFDAEGNIDYSGRWKQCGYRSLNTK